MVPILPGKPPVGLLVPVDPHSVNVRHGGALDVHVVVAHSHLDWLTTKEAELKLFGKIVFFRILCNFPP